VLEAVCGTACSVCCPCCGRQRSMHTLTLFALPALSLPAGAAAAADFVVGLHQPQPQGQAVAASDRWYILQGCSGSLRGGQVVGLLGPSGGRVAGSLQACLPACLPPCASR
jgi:hypothetical protein